MLYKVVKTLSYHREKNVRTQMSDQTQDSLKRPSTPKTLQNVKNISQTIFDKNKKSSSYHQPTNQQHEMSEEASKHHPPP